MFVRADQLRIEQIEDLFPLHALDFSWDGFEPALTCAEGPQGEIVELDLRDVRFAVSRRRICIGYFDGDRHVPCPKRVPVDRLEQCPDCAGESFIPYQDCIFNPRCDGEICDLEFCRREHVLYLAFYDTSVKIGMSSSRRVDRRLVEQGADAYSIIGSFETRRRAREAEKSISSKLRLPQSFRQEVLLDNLARRVDIGGIEKRFEGLRISLEETFGLEAGDIRWIRGYPIELPLRSAPRLEATWGLHKGEHIGLKGRLLIYESNGLKALNLGDMPSRFLSRDAL